MIHTSQPSTFRSQRWADGQRRAAATLASGIDGRVN